MRVLSVKSDDTFEIIDIIREINNSTKLAVLACYRPQLNSVGFMEAFENRTNNHIGVTNNVIVVGDLNYDMSSSDTELHVFCETYGFSNTIKEKTIYGVIGSGRSTLLDVILVLHISTNFYLIVCFPFLD